MLKYLLLFSLLIVSTPSMAAKLALVVGNSDYQNLPSLENPKTDAEGYRETLNELGYDVTFRENLDQRSFELEIVKFLDKVREGDETFFVYTGHGWSDGQVNYLIPVDAPQIGSQRLIQSYSIPLKNGFDGVLDGLAGQGARLQVAIVDACRDNPFRSPEGTRSLGIGRGLSRMQPPNGAFVIFSAGAGQTALDGLPDDESGPKYSVFTRNFLPLLKSNLTLEDAVSVAQEKTAAAAIKVGHNQRPSYYDETLGKTCLHDRCTGALIDGEEETASAQPAPSLCDRLYDEAKTVDQCYAYKGFMTQCSSHAFAPFAQAFINSRCVAAAPKPAGSDQLASLSPEQVPATVERKAPDVPKLEGKPLIEKLQSELNRVGCKVGTVDGIWGGKSRAAVASLRSERRDIEIASLEPSIELLETLGKLEGSICPLTCAITEEIKDGECVAKTCPSGQRLSSRGQCYTPATKTTKSSSGSTSSRPAGGTRLSPMNF